MDEFTVKFMPFDKEIRVLRGTDLLSAATKCGIAVNSSCGGEGLCGKCRLVVKRGEIKTEPSKILSERDRAKGTVLACETLVESDLEVMVPAESIEFHRITSHDAEEYSKGVILKREDAFRHLPLVRKFYIELPPPDSDDNLSDLDRIYRALQGKLDSVFISTKVANVKLLGDVIRESDFKVTVTVAYKDGAAEIISVEPGDTGGNNFGFAFDIGTTTVVGQLVDLDTKKILGSRIAYNKQASFGSDVITRIICGSEPQGLKKLNEAILDNINEMIGDICRTSGVSIADIHAVVCAGNMAMMHFLLEIDPTHIRKAPYIPTTTTFEPVHSSEIGINANPKATLYCLPGVTTYIGGDIVGGVLASGLFESSELSLLIDIGTNGEIVLGNNEWMMGAAASAGPAFEGSGLDCGMKAVSGAIQKVKIGDDLEVKFETIDGAKAKGICGSAYIDILEEMLKKGIINRDGKIDRARKSRRIRKGETTYEFIVAFNKESAIGRDIVITEDDIENLKRAKGAIYSAIISLLNKVEKDISEVKKICIAGGFGNYIDIGRAVAIGLLPDVPLEVYEYIGNSSLAGARMSLLSHEAFAKTRDIAKSLTYLDLSSEPKYMDEYVASLFFPHTDIGRFPSVRL